MMQYEQPDETSHGSKWSRTGQSDSSEAADGVLGHTLLDFNDS